MRKTFCLLVVLVVVCASGFGQSVPRFDSPKIVATFKSVGQTAGISPFTIYTPKNSGVFRISIVMVLTVANGNLGSWNAVTLFTNGGGKDFGEPEVSLNTNHRTSEAAETPLRAKAGLPITFQVVSSGNTQGSKYTCSSLWSS